MNMNVRKWRRNWSPFFISYKSDFDKIIGHFLQTENLLCNYGTMRLPKKKGIKE